MDHKLYIVNNAVHDSLIRVDYSGERLLLSISPSQQLHHYWEIQQTVCVISSETPSKSAGRGSEQPWYTAAI